MESMKLLEELFDKKLLRIIQFFIQNKDKGFYLQEVSNNAGVPIASVFRIIRKLKELKIIEEIRIKKFKLYKFAENETTNFLESIIKEDKRIIDKLINEITAMEKVEEIILHGKDSTDKANILLIGMDIDYNEIKRICTAFKEKYNYIINSLSLTREQYAQMLEMGLYSGKKTIIFKR